MNEPGMEREPATMYVIRVKGILSDQWLDWFDGMTIDYEADGNTRLSGPVVDQAALHGLLDKVGDLGLPLLSVMPIVDEDAAAGGIPLTVLPTR